MAGREASGAWGVTKAGLVPPPTDRKAVTEKPKRREINLKKRQADIQAAFESGMKINYGQPNMLLIDCDSKEAYNRVFETLRWARNLLGIDHVTFTRSKSQNWHIYVYLTESFDQTTRVLLQGALGGDPKRALLDWRRTEQSGPISETVLFETRWAEETNLDLGELVEATY